MEHLEKLVGNLGSVFSREADHLGIYGGKCSSITYRQSASEQSSHIPSPIIHHVFLWLIGWWHWKEIPRWRQIQGSCMPVWDRVKLAVNVKRILTKPRRSAVCYCKCECRALWSFEGFDQMETIHDNAEKRKTLGILFHGEISPFLWRNRQKNPLVKHLREITLMVKHFLFIVHFSSYRFHPQQA